MSRMAMIVALSLAVAAPAALGQGARPTYRGVETSTDEVSPPAVGASSWTFQPCATCKFVTLQIDANSAYFVGTDPVSLDVLRRYAARSPARLDVYYENQSRRLLRVVLRTQLDATDRSAVQPRGKR